MSMLKIVSDFTKLNQLIVEISREPAKRILHDGVEYGVYQEYGWTSPSGNPVPAQPFMSPAIEAIRPAFEKGWSQLANLTSAEAFVEKCARDAENVAKRTAPVDTGALKNSIAVSRPEDMPELYDVHAEVTG